MWQVHSCHLRLCAPLHSQYIAIFVMLTCVRILCIRCATTHLSIFLGVTYTMLECGLGKRDVASSFLPSAPLCTSAFTIYRHFRDVYVFLHSLYTMCNDTFLNILGCHVYDVRVWPRQARCGALIPAIRAFVHLCIHNISSFSSRLRVFAFSVYIIYSHSMK
jgi:hypothetical protein